MPGSSSTDDRRIILHDAVRGLVRAASADRAVMAEDAPERQFSLGVEAAAEELLHPERADARPPGWLDRESLAFRSGYLRTQSLLATAATAERPPLELRPPQFDPAHR